MIKPPQNKLFLRDQAQTNINGKGKLQPIEACHVAKIFYPQQIKKINDQTVPT
jgi:hypothetical protein